MAMYLPTADPTDMAAAAHLFRGLADPTRLRILLELREGPSRVTDLVAALGAAQSTVSAHLACLVDCGLVARRAVGRQNFYRIAQPHLFDLLAAAEEVLAATGHHIDLCPNYRGA